MAMKENTRKIWDYVVAHDGEDIIAQDIADALGLNTRQVNGSINSFTNPKKGLMVRSEDKKKFELEDGTVIEAKTISLTDAGRAFDPDQSEE